MVHLVITPRDISMTTKTRSNIMSKSDPCVRNVEKPNCIPQYKKVVALTILVAIQVPLLPTNFSGESKSSLYVGPYSCTFRDYDYNPDRLYGIADKDYPPPFLRVSFYIFGKPPILLPLSEKPTKVCGFGEGLVMDGTNPSMLSIARLREKVSLTTATPWNGLPEGAFLVSTAFKLNHQCKYFGEEKEKTRFEPLPGRKAREADLLIVDSMIRPLWQSHIWDFSTLGSTHPTHYTADDVRLFLHDGDIWISYKRYRGDGEGMDGNTQRINRLFFGHHDSKLVAIADPTNEIELCCGRNFGALAPTGNDQQTLSLLTWPDPVKVKSLNTREVLSQQSHLVDLKEERMTKSLMPNKKPSEYHGTSNQLLFVPDWNEYLGVGHLHRERKWNGNLRKDAAYGHHYTHSFFTISAERPYHLKRLSQEFLFPSQVNQSDADVVQFASGLEWDTPDAILIGYGINDCEGAIVRVELEFIKSMLKTVEVGTQVAHTMRNMSRSEFLERVNASHPMF